MMNLHFHKKCRLGALLVSMLFTLGAEAANELAQTFTLDGQLLQASSDQALLDTHAKIVIEILDPSKNCLLYEEQQFVNTSASSGYYNILVGSILLDAKRTGLDPGRTMAQIYQNTVAITAANAPGKTCSGLLYTPAINDGRYFRLIVTPTSTGTPDTLSPDTMMDSVPMAITAQTLQGYAANQFLILGAGDLTQANLTSVFAAGNATKLNALLATPAANYVTKDSSSGLINLPAASGVPTGVAAGQIWYDSGVLKYYNGSVQTLSSGSGITSLIIGSGLTPTGTISTGGQSIAVDTGITANKVLQLNGTAKIPAVDGSLLTGLTGSQITYASQTANTFFAAPSGSAGAPVFRAMTALDIPGLDWTKITSGTPTTLSGYGITDAVGNLGGTPGIKTGTDALKPASPTAGTIYFATDSNRIWQYNSGAWAVIASATATSYSGVLPVANGGTNSSTTLTNNKIMVSSGGAIVESAALTNGQLLIGSTGAAPAVANLTQGSGISITNGAGSVTIATTGLGSTSLADGKIWVGQTTTPTAVTPGGDVIMTNAGSFSVTKLQGTNVSSTTPTISGQTLRYNSGTSSWEPKFISMADLRSTITGSSALTSCTSGQTLTWSAATDNLACSNITVSASNFASQAQNSVFAGPSTGGPGAPAFRALASTDLPSGIATTGTYKSVTVDTYGRVTAGTNPTTAAGYGITDAFINGGNSFGGAATLGTNDNNTLGLKTNGAVNMTMLANGNVGIGTTSPNAQLSVFGAAQTTTAFSPAGNTGGSLLLYDSGSSAGNGGALLFAASNGGTPKYTAAIKGLQTSSTVGSSIAAGDLAFSTGATPSDSTLTERMRILSTGNVGIGTTAPDPLGAYGSTYGRILDVVSTNSGPSARAILELWSNSTPTAGQVNGQISFLSGTAPTAGPGAAILSSNNGTTANTGNLVFYTSSTSGGTTERMRIDHGGNVGIGTTSPINNLSIRSQTGTAASLGLYNSDFVTTSVGSALGIQFGATSGNTYSGIQSYTAGASAVGNIALNAGGGSVGIGTTSPSNKLVVGDDSVGASGVPNNTISVGNASGNAQVRVGQSTAANGIFSWIYNATPANAYLALTTSGSYPLALQTAGGNVGIGTTSPGSLLDVGTTGSTQVASLPGALRLKKYSTNNIAYIDGYDGVSDIGLELRPSNAGVLQTGVTIDKNGNVGIGTTAPGLPLDVNGLIRSRNTNAQVIMDSTGTGTGNYAVSAYRSAGASRFNIGLDGDLSSTKLSVYDVGAGAYSTVWSGGNVGIGTTNPTYTLHVVGTAGLSTGTAWTNASDIRLKDIQGDYEYGLKEILQLHTVRYNYKKDNPLGLPSDFSKTGFIAQEVQKVIPDAVNTRKDGYLELNVDPIHWAVVNAIKDLYHKWFDDSQSLHRDIVIVREENLAIKTENAALRARLDEQSKELLAQSKIMAEQSKNMATQSRDLASIKKKLGM